MRVAIVGSRGYLDLNSVASFIDSLPANTVVITGETKGVDAAAAAAAKQRGLEVVVHLADWVQYGKAAGQIRNQKVVDDCDRLVAFWNGTSPGTKGTISIASKAGKLEKVFKDRNPTQGNLF